MKMDNLRGIQPDFSYNYDLFALTINSPGIDMNVAILLGAGASIPAGYPSTQCITDQVLTGRGVTRHSDSTFEIGGDAPPTGITLAANKMTNLIRTEIEYYVDDILNRSVNYEDLSNAAQQIRDELLGELDDPLLFKYSRKIRTQAESIVIESASATFDRLDSFESLISETCNYISDIVWRMLARDTSCLSHLNFINHIHKLSNITNISTLCHDTHIETFLEQSNIPFSDGFLEPETDVRFWGNKSSPDSKIPFLKLHGSVNWFYFASPENTNTFEQGLGIPLHHDHHHTKTRDGEYRYSSFRPALLVGTFNKMLKYSSGIFLDIYPRFRETLRNTDRLVICGYSFGDKGINSELLYWFYQQQNRQFIIIHPDPTEHRKGARPAIQKMLQGHDPIFIMDRIENIDMNRLTTALDT